MEVADVVDIEARLVFIEHADDLPSYPNQPDLRVFIRKWDKENRMLEDKKKIMDIESKFKLVNLEKKLKKFTGERNQLESM